MITVLLLTDSARPLFERMRVYFEPYLEAGILVDCAWNQSRNARTMKEALPELPGLIKGHRSWRAIVVDHPGESSVSGPAPSRDPENPFDFLDNASYSLDLRDSEHALIRVAHALLGFPQMAAKQFREKLRYEHATTGEIHDDDPAALIADYFQAHPDSPYVEYDLASQSSEGLRELAQSTIGATHKHLQSHFVEEPYPEHEQKKHAELVQRYRMREVRPSEVIFISTRPRLETDEKEELRRAWNSSDERAPSRFIERNDYPSRTRFVTYELLEEENSGYEQDLLRFCLSILTIAKNELPPGGFQAERVYRMGVDFEVQGLGHMLNTHISQLAMMRDRIDRVLDAPPRAIKSDAINTMAPVETSVTFEDLGGEELEASAEGYGLAADYPRDEHRRWTSEVARISSAGTRFMRKPKRLAARAVHSARLAATAPTDEAVVLDDLERADLQDNLTRRIRNVVVPTTGNLLDQERIQAAVEEGDHQVRDFISQRMPTSTILIGVTIALAVWFAALLPYILQAGRLGDGAVPHSVIVILAVLGVVGIAVVLTLLVSRWLLLRRIQSFNQRVGAEINQVHTGASRIGEFLSDYATYRQGAELLRNAHRTEDLRTSKIRRLRALRARIVKHIEEEKQIVRALGVKVEVTRTFEGLSDFSLDDPDVERRLFRFPVEARRIPFNDSGEFVRAPYDFVSKLTLEKLSIFERVQVGTETQAS